MTAFLLRRAALHQPASLSTAARRHPAAASFHAAARAQQKESNIHEAQRAANVEQAKKQQDNPRMREELSSDSEDAIKADRNETASDASKDTERLQRETEHEPAKKHGQK